jgi:VanZ family protein
MEGIINPVVPYRQGALWLVWLLSIFIWTTALLTTYPVRVKEAVFTPQAGYPASKLLHVGAYAVLAAAAAWLLPGSKYRLLPVLFLSLHAFGTEYLQTFTESRTGSLTDVGINHIGIALGFVLTCWKWLPIERTNHGSKHSGQ